MQTARAKTEAKNYIDRRGLVLTGKNDQFLHTTRTERYIEPKTESGGTTVNSGGSSHQGGKF